MAGNREERGEQTLDGNHRRGEHRENRIKELKLDFGMERMPCGPFHAGARFFAVGVLAYNLFNLFAGTVLPASWKTKRAGGVRYAIHAVAGKVVSTGGQLWLRVGREAYELFAPVRRALARMGSG
ncbi:MAG: transposase [Acidobacteriota bacterium]